VQLCAAGLDVLIVAVVVLQTSLMLLNNQYSQLL
jgi:hypothetical protein